LFGEVHGRLLAGTSARKRGGGTDVNSSAKKSASRDNDDLGPERSSLNSLDSRDAVAVEEKASDRPLNGDQASMLFEERPHSAPVQASIALGTGRPHSRSLPAIQHSELQRGQVGGPGHYAPHRVNFAHDRALCDAPDRWIARHLTDGFQRAGDKAYAAAEPTCCHSGFSSRVACADDDYVECLFESTGWRSHPQS
jgi:hypothetical protein